MAGVVEDSWLEHGLHFSISLSDRQLDNGQGVCWLWFGIWIFFWRGGISSEFAGASVTRQRASESFIVTHSTPSRVETQDREQAITMRLSLAASAACLLASAQAFKDTSPFILFSNSPYVPSHQITVYKYSTAN